MSTPGIKPQAPQPPKWRRRTPGDYALQVRTSSLSDPVYANGEARKSQFGWRPSAESGTIIRPGQEMVVVTVCDDHLPTLSAAKARAEELVPVAEAACRAGIAAAEADQP